MEQTTLIRRVWSTLELAMKNVLAYSKQEQTTIFIWEVSYGENSTEYIFKIGSEIQSIKADNIIHVEHYTKAPYERMKKAEAERRALWA